MNGAIAVFTTRREQSAIWDELSVSDQKRLNRNRRAMGLQPRTLSAIWDVVVVGSSERTEDQEDVPEWVGV